MVTEGDESRTPSCDQSPAPPAAGQFRASPARWKADMLTSEVARRARRAEASAERIRRLKDALLALLADLTCRVKAQEPLPGELRDLPPVLRETHKAIED